MDKWDHMANTIVTFVFAYEGDSLVERVAYYLRNILTDKKQDMGVAFDSWKEEE